MKMKKSRLAILVVALVAIGAILVSGSINPGDDPIDPLITTTTPPITTPPTTSYTYTPPIALPPGYTPSPDIPPYTPACPPGQYEDIWGNCYDPSKADDIDIKFDLSQEGLFGVSWLTIIIIGGAFVGVLRWRNNK